jgi:hypothetical protein
MNSKQSKTNKTEKKRKSRSRKRAGTKVLRGRGDYINDYGSTEEGTDPKILDLEKKVAGLEAFAANGTNMFTGKKRGKVNALASGAGKAIGGMFGGPGAWLGEHAASGLATLLGHGDYSVKKNSIMKSSQSIPSFAPSGSRWVEVEHREYLFDVVSPAGSPSWEIVNTFNLNPGLASTFPWLSAIAQSYEEYEFDGCVVIYEATSSNFNSANQSLGSVQIATQYDVLDTGFSSQMEMLEYEFASSERCDKNIMHPVECNPKDNQVSVFYVRSGTVANTALQLYDLGIVSVAVQGISAASINLGKIWISYKVRLGKPKLYAGQLGKGILFDHFKLTTAITNTTYFGASSAQTATVVSGSTLGGTLPSTSSGAVYATYAWPPMIQAGSYRLCLSIVGTSGTCTAPTLTLTNCVLGITSAATKIFNTATTATDGQTDITSHTSTTLCCEYYVTITAQSASVLFSTASIPATSVSGDLLVLQVPSTLV